jgi:DNA-binding transcriptional ArsR family regulator
VDNYSAALDAIFAALSDATRRAMLRRLSEGELSISELASPTGISLPAVMKHLATLESAGLIAREKSGRVVTCRLTPAALREAEDWLQHYARFWERQIAQLGRYLANSQGQEARCTTSRTPGSGSSARSRRRGSGSTKRGPTRGS